MAISFFSVAHARMSTIFCCALLLTSKTYANDLLDLERRLKQHPRLQAMQYQAQAHRDLSSSVMGLPDPIVSLGVNNFPIFDPSFDEFIPTNKAIGVKQNIPSLAGRKARSAVSKSQAQEAETRWQQLYAAMKAQLIIFLIEQNRISEQTALLSNKAIKLTELSSAIESELDAGEASVFKLAQVKEQRIELARQKIVLEQAQIDTQARIEYLVGQTSELNPTVSLRKWSQDVHDFHGVRVAKVQSDVTKNEVKQARTAYKPNWGLQLTYQQREAGVNFEGDDFVSGMVTFSVPIWDKRNQRPKLQAATAKFDAAQQAVEAAISRSVVQYTSLGSRYQAALEGQDLIRQKISALQEQVDARKNLYESGSTYYTQIIETELAVIDQQMALLNEQAKASELAAQMNAMLINETPVTATTIEGSK